MTVQLHLDGREQSERVCACGRGCSLDQKRRDAKWASEACQKHWLREHPAQPLSAAHMTDVTPTRERSGLQVSYPKAREVLEEHFASRGEDYPHNLAVNLLKAAMSERQRAKLEHRIRAQRAAFAAEIEQQQGAA